MTLCIAAACLDGDDKKIVLCTDWKEEAEGIGSSETADKLKFVKAGWVALVSGEASPTEALIFLYRNRLKDADLTEGNVYDSLKNPIHERKALLADDYTRQVLGITYGDFINNGKGTFPEDFFRQHLYEIERIRLGTSLIICGFIEKYDYVNEIAEKHPLLITIDDDTSQRQDIFSLELDFAAIGSGASSALAALFNREQSSDTSLLHTIYFLYEANRLSEKVPGVGEQVSIEVLDADGNIQSLSEEGYDKCDELFRRFGPRLITDKHSAKFKMEQEYLESFYSEWNKRATKRKEISLKSSD